MKTEIYTATKNNEKVYQPKNTLDKTEVDKNHDKNSNKKEKQ